jgi:SAM-dependent methyltransferase
VDDKKTDISESRYANGGPSYSLFREWWWHRRHLIQRFRVPRGAWVLEAACGAGFHTHLLNRMGLRCIGVDGSEMGIRWARERYPHWTYLCHDPHGALPFDPATFDLVITRRRCLHGQNAHEESAIALALHLMRYVKQGGLLVLVILEAAAPARTGQSHRTRLSEYQRQLARLTPNYAVETHNNATIYAARNDSPRWLRSERRAGIPQPCPTEAVAEAATGGVFCG